jgi:hypothetical protein
MAVVVDLILAVAHTSLEYLQENQAHSRVPVTSDLVASDFVASVPVTSDYHALMVAQEGEAYAAHIKNSLVECYADHLIRQTCSDQRQEASQVFF